MLNKTNPNETHHMPTFDDLDAASAHPLHMVDLELLHLRALPPETALL
jgi:hypothetical protein